MKATGIVRRIDDLGRVVVPKEIRRTLRIREGDPLEIFTDRDGEIILKKYSPIGEMGGLAQQFCESASQILNATVGVSDHDTFLAAAGTDKKILLGKMIHEDLEGFLQERQVGSTKTLSSDFPSLVDGCELPYKKNIAATILSQGDVIGSIVILDREDAEALTIAKTGSILLGKQME